MYEAINGTERIVKWGTLEDLATNCHALWKVTNKDGVFDIVNMATDFRFNNITGNPVTMSAESENLMVLEPVATIEGVTYVNIRTNSQDPKTNAYIYLHQAGHSSIIMVPSAIITPICSTASVPTQASIPSANSTQQKP
jgi:hypothetical protein